jgi:hypothetical protein
MPVKGCQECKDLHTGWKALTGADSRLRVMQEAKLWKFSRISPMVTVGRKWAHISLSGAVAGIGLRHGQD